MRNILTRLAGIEKISHAKDIRERFQAVREERLNEASRGLLYREPGDTFIQGSPTAPTATLTFVKVEYFPGQPGEFSSYEEMMEVVEELKVQYPGIQFTNVPNRGFKALAIMTLDGPNPDQQTYIARFFHKITKSMAGQWKNNDIPGGWQLTKKSSLKASYGLKPADLFTSKSTFKNATAVIADLNSNPKITPMMPGLQMALAGVMPIFEGQAAMLGAIQDDLGEIMAPIALSQGLITDHGAEGAKRDLLDGADWRGCKISFPTAKNNGLVDSFVYVNGIEIGISSKGKKGANASIKNVMDGVELAREAATPEYEEMLEKYAEQIAIIEQIGDMSALMFPLMFAVEHDMLSPGYADKIDDLCKMGATSLDELKTLTNKDKVFLEERFINTINAVTTNPNYNIGFHILSALAKEVATAINSDPVFGTMCLAFVNINPIVQIYLTAAKKGNDVVVTNFKSLYPPNFQGTIKLVAEKSYSATGVIGKMSFSYLPDKVAAEKIVSASVKLAKADAKVAAQIDKVKTGRVAIRQPGIAIAKTPEKSPRQKR